MDITNLASLPTDSLYKFMALFGLVMTILVVVSHFYFRKIFMFQVYDLRKHLDTLELRCGGFLDKAQNHLLRLDSVQAELQRLSQREVLESGERFETTLLKQKVERLNSEVNVLGGDVKAECYSIDLAINKIELECDTKKVEFLASQLQLLTAAQVLGLVVGVSLSISGFYFWYDKQQVFIDEAVAAQATSKSTPQ